MKTADPNFIGKTIPNLSNVQVMSYLITTHHEFTRNMMDEIGELSHEAGLELADPPEELAQLGAMWKKYHEDMEKVKLLADKLSQKGGYAPVLARLAYKLNQLNQDLQEHMAIESSLLFPRILGKKL